MSKKTLKNLIELSSQVKIYIPSTIKVDQAFDSALIVDRIAGQFSDLFGGSTILDAVGCWASNE